MKKNDFICHQKDKVNILLWHDKKVVSFISTFSNFENDIIGNSKLKISMKPSMINDYDLNMGGVDRFDQQLHSYFNERKNKKWPNKLAMYLINLMVHNCYILYKTFYNLPDKINCHLKFRIEFIYYFAKDTSKNASVSHMKTTQVVIKSLPLQSNIVLNLPSQYPKGKPRRCVYCSNSNKRKTSYYCTTCNVSLCFTGCYRNYHLDLYDDTHNDLSSFCSDVDPD